MKIFSIALLLSCTVFTASAKESEISTDLLIVGATESGWAAAVQAARGGVKSITIVHDGKWYGGQFTEQALACVDENKGLGKIGWGVDWHPMKRSFHRSGLFKELMDKIETQNTEKYGSPMPGKPFHGPTTFRPAEAEAMFRSIIQPYIESGQIRVVWNHYPVSAEVEGSKLKGMSFAKLGSDKVALRVQAKLTIDASDWGEVIQIAGAAFEFGPDPASRYGEASAPADLSRNPLNEMNPITWTMIVEQSDGETPIAKPSRFDDRNYPRATGLGREFFADLKWDHSKKVSGGILHWPLAGKASSRQLSVYTVRRIVDGYESKDGKTSILLAYMNGQDYPLERLPQPVVDALEKNEVGASQKNIVEMTRAQREIIFQDARQHSLGVLYHLQNFVNERAKDKTNSFRNFHLSDEFGTEDNLPPKPYIREGLRLKAMYMMREQDSRNRDGETKDKAKVRFAKVMYPDGLFPWQFHYDFHRTGRTYLKEEGASGPWIDFHKPNRHTKFMSDRSVFPLRSLIPEKMDGLLGAQGNVGFSSIVSAAIRLHDQRIQIGQAAGATAVVVLRTGGRPREMVYDRAKLEAIRDELCGEREGAVPALIWPFRDLPADHVNFVAINRLAALGVLPIGSREVDIHPDDPSDGSWMQEVLERSGVGEVGGLKTEIRGVFCQKVWDNIREDGWENFEFNRKSKEDADEDGILDRDDALLFTPNAPIVFKVEKAIVD
ncbi:MAG: FAD-dependent oxidoreductase [Verrucomicrobia bacterium]|nr:FAD-dependent oxidoreductase [Verrucomicrobiota bacterium]